MFRWCKDLFERCGEGKILPDKWATIKRVRSSARWKHSPEQLKHQLEMGGEELVPGQPDLETPGLVTCSGSNNKVVFSTPQGVVFHNNNGNRPTTTITTTMLRQQTKGITRIITLPGQGKLIPPQLIAALAPAHRRSTIAIPHRLAQPLFDTSTPKEYFLRSSHLQPSVVYVSLLIVELLQHRGITLEAKYILGHSLGELTALVLNGVLEKDAAVEIAHRRGLFMEAAVDREKQYGMYAYIFKEGGYDFIKEALKKWDSLGIANYNTTTQCVVSGEVKELAELTDYLKKEMKIKATKLDVILPFHNKKLSEAKDKFRELMKNYDVNTEKRLQVPIASNLDGQLAYTHGEAMEKFIEDFSTTVEFVKCLQTVIHTDDKVQFLNIGPNARVIQTMANKADKEGRIVNNKTLETLEDISLFE